MQNHHGALIPHSDAFVLAQMLRLEKGEFMVNIVAHQWEKCRIIPGCATDIMKSQASLLISVWLSVLLWMIALPFNHSHSCILKISHTKTWHCVPSTWIDAALLSLGIQLLPKMERIKRLIIFGIRNEQLCLWGYLVCASYPCNSLGIYPFLGVVLL